MALFLVDLYYFVLFCLFLAISSPKKGRDFKWLAVRTHKRKNQGS